MSSNNSPIVLDEIVSIEFVGEEETYDITVDHPSHTFYANGISVSNCSHATAYAIDSYWCAWLLKHHEIEWLTSYLEHHSTTPDKRAVAFGEIKKMGYKIVPIDINTANASWASLPNKQFMPSFLSCKGMGNAAIDELLEMRPYTSIENLLWNDDGSWKHSKFNKRALEALIKIGGLNSLDCVGPDKMFSSYKQLHHVIIENQDKLKKSPKKDPQQGRKVFYELIKETQDMDEWSPKERASNMEEVFGSIDVLALVDQDIIDNLTGKGIEPIDALEEGSKSLAWFVITNQLAKKTKNNKKYLAIDAMGPTSKAVRLFCWGWDGVKKFEPFTLCVAEVEKNDFGCSTTMWKLKEL